MKHLLMIVAGLALVGRNLAVDNRAATERCKNAAGKEQCKTCCAANGATGRVYREEWNGERSCTCKGRR